MLVSGGPLKNRQNDRPTRRLVEADQLNMTCAVGAKDAAKIVTHAA